LDRVGIYKERLWRQAAQTVWTLDAMRRPPSAPARRPFRKPTVLSDWDAERSGMRRIGAVDCFGSYRTLPVVTLNTNGVPSPTGRPFYRVIKRLKARNLAKSKQPAISVASRQSDRRIRRGARPLQPHESGPRYKPLSAMRA